MNHQPLTKGQRMLFKNGDVYTIIGTRGEGYNFRMNDSRCLEWERVDIIHEYLNLGYAKAI